MAATNSNAIARAVRDITTSADYCLGDTLGGAPTPKPGGIGISAARDARPFATKIMLHASCASVTTHVCPTEVVCIAASPVDPKLVAVGCTAGPLISSDGGTSWQRFGAESGAPYPNNPGLHADLHALRFNATGRRRALVEIESFRDDPDGLINKIDAAIDMATQHGRINAAMAQAEQQRKTRADLAAAKALDPGVAAEFARYGFSE